MTDAGTLLRDAVRHHQAGRLEKAAALYDEVLARQPRNADALHLLGLVAHQGGDNARAVGLIERALAINAAEPLYHNNLGLVVAALGRHEEAITHYRRAFAIAPGYPEAHCNLANALQALDRHGEAVDAYETAVSLAPDYVEALNNLGISLSQIERDEQAVSAFRKGLALAPQDADLHKNLGLSLQKLGRYEEALASCRAALSLAPDSADAHLNMGNVLQSLNRHEAAIASFRHALSLDPDSAVAFNNLANSLVAIDQTERAAELYGRAVAAAPQDAGFHNNLGNALHWLRRHADALRSYENALANEPLHPNALSYVSYIKREICDWSGGAELDDAITDHVRSNRVPVTPFSFLSVTDDPALQLQCAVQFQAAARTKTALSAPSTGTTKGKLRIGYISDMFRKHALSYLIAELIELHDRSKFEICAFSYGRDDGSAIRRRLEAAFDEFHDVRWESDDGVARRIHASGIDILVDLNGHTDGNRLRILSRRPAEIQAHFLGYPGTLGADFIDYLFVDHFVVPRDQAKNYAENLVYLPDSYQVNDRKRPIAEGTPTRQEHGLPHDGIVFCCFNQTYKVTPALFDIWMALLRDVPDSVLWLLRSNETAQDNLCREAERQNVDAARLVFAPRAELPDHLSRVRLADLFLDTIPVNAHTTASDALWAGVPVLTCAGRSMAARVAGSLLHAVGLPELVTQSLDEYAALARRLASDPDMLRRVRGTLEANRETGPLFDTERFRRHIEAAYERMWALKQAGERPRSFTVSPVSP